MVTKTGPFQGAIVGLGFGAEFIPIYQRHPDVNIAAICRRDEAKLCEMGAAFGIEKCYAKYDELLADPAIDFVHINSPIPDHAWMSIEALRAGQHEIEQHHVGPHPQHLGQRQIAARHQGHVDAVRAQVLRRQPRQALVVLHVHDAEVLQRVAGRIGRHACVR